MEEEQKINAKIKDESVGEKHNRIISIKKKINDYDQYRKNKG